MISIIGKNISNRSYMENSIDKLIKNNLLGFLIVILSIAFGLFLLGFNFGRYYFDLN